MTNWRLLLTAMLFFFLGGIAVLAFAQTILDANCSRGRWIAKLG